MEDSTKFGDFFDDELEPVDGDEFISPPTYKVPSAVSSYGQNDKSEQKVGDAIDSLTQKYNLPLRNYSVKEVLDNIDKIDTDDDSFNLVASKITTDYLSRVMLRGVITSATMVNKIFELMDRTDIRDIGPDTLLMIDKAFGYQDRLFSIYDRYKKAGVNSSLEHIAQEKDKKKDAEKIALTPDEIRRIVNEINREKEK